jgi:hypothetical protein
MVVALLLVEVEAEKDREDALAHVMSIRSERYQLSIG